MQLSGLLYSNRLSWWICEYAFSSILVLKWNYSSQVLPAHSIGKWTSRTQNSTSCRNHEHTSPPCAHALKGLAGCSPHCHIHQQSTFNIDAEFPNSIGYLVRLFSWLLINACLRVPLTSHSYNIFCQQAWTDIFTVCLHQTYHRHEGISMPGYKNRLCPY